MPLNVDSLNAGTISQNGNPVKPYKVYTALLTQSGEGATPTVAQEFENSFDGITFTWSRIGNGTFLCVASEEIFKFNKCIGFAYSGGDAEDGYQGALVQPPSIFSGFPENECRVVIPSGFDHNILIRLEIRVYN